MTRPLRIALAIGFGLLVGSITAYVIAIVMVTFSIASTPDWALGVWFLWVLIVIAITYPYTRKWDL